MKEIVKILLVLSPLSLSAQIGREFNFEKGKSGLTKVRAISYTNVKLDEQDMPIPQLESDGEIITLYQDGYVYEVQYFDENDGKKEIQSRILLERNGIDIKKAAIYTYFQGKESLLRAHEAFYVNGKITLENITGENGKLYGTTQYETGKTSDGIDFIKMTSTGIGSKKELLRQFDDDGEVFYSEHMGGKLSKSSRRTSIIKQDTVKTITYLLLNENEAQNGSVDSIHLITRTHYDKKGNPTLGIMKYTASKAPEGEEKEMVVAMHFENFYGTDVAPKPEFPTKEALEAEWKSEKDNLTVFFTPKNEKGVHGFACFPLHGMRKLIPGAAEKEMITSVEDGWKDEMIAMNNGTYEYDPGTGKLTVLLHNGKKVQLLAKMEWNTLILTPATGKGNALRLVKARN